MKHFWTMLSTLILCAGGMPAHAQDSAAPEAPAPLAEPTLSGS
jgi:hypothetical protein